MNKRITLAILVILIIAVLCSCKPAAVVSFNTNGGSEIQDIVLDENFKLPEEPKKADFMFVGWYLDEALTQAYEKTPTESCTLYAKWLSLKWTLTLDAGEGSVSQTTQTVTIDSTYTLPVASRTGYYFVGWYDAVTGGTRYTDEAGESFAKWLEFANKTLYARYSEIPVVSFVTNSQTTIADRYADAEFTMPADPVKEGYEFLGWYKQNNTNEKFTFTSYEQFTQSTTLYAQWRSKNWTITLNAGEGSVDPATKGVTIGSAYTLPVASRTGYYFVGWFDAATGGTKYTNATGESIANWAEYANKTLYAQYAAIPVVTFNSNGGTEIAPRYADEDFEMPDDPIRDGYTFLGWYTEDNTDNQFVFTDISVITYSIVLYAQWDWIPVDTVIDDFTGYADIDALKEVWSTHNSTVELVDGKMVLTAIQNDGQVQIEISRDYSGLKSFQMEFATGANNGEFQISFNVGNEKYPSRSFVGNGSEQTVAFQLDTLQPEGDFQGYIGYIIIKLPTAGTSITIGKVELLVEEKTLEVEADPEDRMLYNFDALEDDDALAALFSVEAGTKTLVEGKDGIGKAMSFSGNVGSYTAVKDWSGHQFIRFDFKTSANNVFFYLQFSDGGNYPYTTITGNGKWQTAVVALNRFSPLNLSNVVCLYLNSLGNSVIIDNIEILLEGTESLPQADPEDMTLYSFDSYASDEELQAVMKSNGGTATLADGEDEAKAMSLSGGQVYTNPTFLIWGENHDFLSIKYKTSANNIKLSVAMDDWSEKYPYIELVGNGTWQTAVISLDRFSAINLNNVTTLFLKADEGSVLIEEIKLLLTGTEFLPEADNVEPAAWENFDYLDSAALQEKWSSLDGALPIELNTEYEGHKSAVISPASLHKSIFAQSGYNWSAYNTITVGFKASIGASFYFKVTDYITYHYYLVTSASEDWQEVTFSFNDMADGSTYNWGWIASIQLQNESASDILIDYIDVTYVEPSAPVTKVLVDDFSTYQDSDAVTAKWSPYNATIELVEEDGQKSMKATNTGESSQISYEINADLVALGYQSVVVTFRTSANKGQMDIVFMQYGTYATFYVRVMGTTEWQTISIPIATFVGYDETVAAAINAFMLKPVESGSWIEIASVEFDKAEVKALPYYMYEDGTVAWQNASAEIVDERTVLTSTDAANGYYLQTVWDATPSSNVFHNVKSIKICAKIANGASVKLYVGGTDASSVPYDYSYNLNGTGDWEIYEFAISDMTATGEVNMGWITCVQFSAWGGSQYYVDYIMLSEMA